MTSSVEVRLAVLSDASVIAALAARMWDLHDADKLRDEFAELLRDPEAVVILAESCGEPIGFAQCQLRRDYVEGTASSPVGYLEGVYVTEAWRRRGVARSLLAQCMSWARAQGCREFASDCELDNTDSLAFHLASGFTEANRIICFTRAL